MITALKNRLLTTAPALVRDRSGNFGVIVAVGAMLLLVAVGAAVDTSGAASDKSRMQDLCDMAALAASSSGETKRAKLNVIVDDIMAEHMDPDNIFAYDMKIVDDTIIVSGKGEYDTAFMGIVGFKTLPINTQAGAPLSGSTPVHVAMVLDTTDSMQGSNVTALKNAAGEFVKIVEKGKNNGAKMSVVPFGPYVNIGMGNRNAPWMDVPNDYSETQACYMSRPVKSKTGCKTVTKTGYKDGVPYEYQAEEGCTVVYEDYEIEVCPPPKDYTWRGCAGSRLAPLNIEPGADNSSKIIGVMNRNCGSEVLPLTNKFNDVEKAIENLTTSGNTYLPTGLIWGWRSLTPETPFAAESPSDKTIRAMVFMTDGGNTMTQFNTSDDNEGYHYDITASDTDKNNEAAKRMLDICDGIKDDKIKLYTIGYKLPSGTGSTSATLEACATSPATAYSADSAAELEKAFQDIGKSLQTVRLKF